MNLHALKLLLCALLSLAVVTEISAADIDIEKLMSAQDRQDTGIDGLSNQQKAALNQWLEKFQRGEVNAVVIESANEVPEVAATPTAPRAEAEPEPMQEWRKAPDKIDFVSRISSDFNGWEGKTRFTLENGQIWEQRRRGRWKVTMDAPEVRIYQNFMGAFEMEVLEADKRIGVKRIR